MRTQLLIIFSFIFSLCSCGQEPSTMDLSKSCSYYGEEISDDIYEFSSSQEAKSIIDKIVTSVGLKKNFIIKAANVPNAVAIVQGDQRYIYYSQSFINQVNSATSDRWAAISILAHEVGHHLNGHTIQAGGSRPNIELEADEFSGYVLKFMDCPSLKSAQKAMRALSSESGSKTHPPKSARLEAIAVGWSKAVEKLGARNNERVTPKPVRIPSTTEEDEDDLASSGNPYLVLVKVHCYSTEDWTEADNIYININGRRVLSNKRMTDGQSLNASDLNKIKPIPLTAGQITRINIFDDDSGDVFPKDDLLVSIDAIVGMKETDEIIGEHGSGRYGLTYKIIYK